MVVDEGASRSDVDHRDRAPILGIHARQEREEGGLGLTSRSRREDDDVLLHRWQPGEPQGVDDLVLECRTPSLKAMLTRRIVIPIFRL